MTSWLRDLPSGEYLLDMPADVTHEHGAIAITERALRSIGEYEFSTPTSPSAGRVYRRSYKSGDYVFVVVDAPDGHGQLHVPCLALVTDAIPQESPSDGHSETVANDEQTVSAHGLLGPGEK